MKSKEILLVAKSTGYVFRLLESRLLSGVKIPTHQSSVLETAEFRLEAVHTPGHASNHVCYRHAGLNWLFTGDHVIDGSTVVVSSPTVPDPVAVRFGWQAAAEPNLFNKEGLPASPFRTDGG